MIPAVAVCLVLLLMIPAGLLAAIAGFTGQNAAADPGNWSWIIWVTLLVALFGAAQTWKRNPLRPTLAQSVMLVLGLLIAARVGLWSGYYTGGNLDVLLPNNFGDYALHAGQTAYLALQPLPPTEAQILSHAPFAYPHGINWVAALLINSACGMDAALSGTLFIAIAAACAAAWCWSRPFGVAVLLFNGGIAGYVFVQSWILRDYQEPLIWKNILLAMLGTQRGLPLGIAAGLLLLAHARRVLSPNTAMKIGVRLPNWLVVVLIAVLPLFHLHSFAAVMGMLGFAALLRVKRGGVPLLVCMAIAMPAAGALVWRVTGGLTLGGQGGWEPGWWAKEDPWWEAAAMNFGPWILFVALFLTVLCIPRLRQRLVLLRFWALPRRDAAILFVFPALVLGVAAAFYRFHPWPWDNTKFWIWTWLALGALSTEALLRRAPQVIRWPVLIVLFLSGAVSLAGGLLPQHTGVMLADRRELALTARALAGIDVGERFLSAPDHDHPLILNGAKVASGYEGHLWSHGFDYRARREANLKLFTQETPDLEMLATSGATLAFWGAREAALSGAIQPWWRTEENLVARGPGISIYRLQPNREPTGKNFATYWK